MCCCTPLLPRLLRQLPQGDLSPLWGLVHMVLLVAAAGAGLAGMILVLVAFGNSGSSMLLSTHQVLGLISIGEYRQVLRLQAAMTCLPASQSRCTVLIAVVLLLVLPVCCCFQACCCCWLLPTGCGPSWHLVCVVMLTS